MVKIKKESFTNCKKS